MNTGLKEIRYQFINSEILFKNVCPTFLFSAGIQVNKHPRGKGGLLKMNHDPREAERIIWLEKG